MGEKLTVRVARFVVKVPVPRPPLVCVHVKLVKVNGGAEACGSDSVTVRAEPSFRAKLMFADVMPFGGVRENGDRPVPVVV